MIKDRAAWEAWELERLRKTPVDYRENFRLFEALMEEARELGVYPPKNPLEDIEVKIKLARLLNVQTITRKAGPGPK